MTSSQRMGAWDASPHWASNPMNPAKRENLRGELLRKETRAADPARLSMYRPTSNIAIKHEPKLPGNQLWTNSEAQAHISPSGQLPTKPSQRLDRAIANVNNLRFQRLLDPHTRTIPLDGGRLYSPATLDANWVEERRGRNFKSDWHPKELRQSGLWDTEQTANFRVPDPDYKARIAQEQAVATISNSLMPKSSANASTGRDDTTALIHYGQEGFGPAAHQDHTSQTKRGGHWIGISPAVRESVSQTAHGRQEYLEFQMRTATTDPKASFLGTLPGGTTKTMDRWAHQAMQDSIASQKHSRGWTSLYARDYQDYSRNAHSLRPSSVCAHHSNAHVIQRPHTSLGLYE